MTKPLSFRIVSVSDKPNSFGLHGYVLVSRTGKAYEVARSVGQWNTPWIKGMDIDVPMDQNGPSCARYSATDWGYLSDKQ
jgi:hypothetical protein